jgi:hypothetical protein
MAMSAVKTRGRFTGHAPLLHLLQTIAYSAACGLELGAVSPCAAVAASACLRRLAGGSVGLASSRLAMAAA